MSLLLQLFVASSIPVLKILLICAIGAFCARKGLLTPEGRRVLGALSFLVFNPALIFVKLSSTLTPARLLHWWPLVLNTGISTAVGMGLGYLGVRLVRPPHPLRPHTIVAIALGNLGNLPLVIVSTLATSSAEVLHGIPADRAEDLAVSYVVVGLLVPVIAHATIGFSMLRKPDAGELPEAAVAGDGAGPNEGFDPLQTPRAALAVEGDAAAEVQRQRAKAERDTGDGNGDGGEGEDSADGVAVVVDAGDALQKRPLLAEHRAVGLVGSGSCTELARWAGDGDVARVSANGGGGMALAVARRISGNGGGGGHGAAVPRISANGGSGGTEAATLAAASSRGNDLDGWEADGGADRRQQQQQRHQRHQPHPLAHPQPGCSQLHARRSSSGDGAEGEPLLELQPMLPPPPTVLPQQHQVNPKVNQHYYPNHHSQHSHHQGQQQGYQQEQPHHRQPHHHNQQTHQQQQQYRASDPGRRRVSHEALEPGSLLGGTGKAAAASAAASWGVSSRQRRRLEWHARVDLRALGRQVLREVTSPPLLAILLSVPVGCVRPLQQAFFGDGGGGDGGSGSGRAPLGLLTDCLSMLGDCTIPSILLLLGATLANGPGAARVPLRVIGLVNATRLALLPLLGLGLVMGAYAARAFEAPDPIYLLVLLIQNTAPTAIMVHTMASVQCNRAEEVSSILFWGYIAGIALIPLWLTLFLFVVKQQFRYVDGGGDAAGVSG